MLIMTIELEDTEVLPAYEVEDLVFPACSHLEESKKVEVPRIKAP
jgi:hypothetical protein